MKDTDHEKVKLKELLGEQLNGETAKNRFGHIAQIEAIRAAEIRADEAGANGLPIEPIVDIEGNPVRLVETDEGPQVEVRNEETGEWEIRMTDFEPKDEYPGGPGIGDAEATASSKLGSAYDTGSKAAGPAKEPGESGDIEKADVWAPILPERVPDDEPPIFTAPGIVEVIEGSDETA